MPDHPAVSGGLAGPLSLVLIGVLLARVFMFDRDQIERGRQAQLHASQERLQLALIRRILQAHAGHIRVESDGVGRGSAFGFSLPQPDTLDEAEA